MTPVRPVLGAIAVLVTDRHVLLVQRGKAPDKGLWGFPGGHVELGETALAAAARELREETGIIAEPREYLTNIDVLRHAPDGALSAHYLLTAVLCDHVRGTPQAADDALDARWFAHDDVRAGRLPMSAHVAEVMELALLRRAQARRPTARTSTAPR